MDHLEKIVSINIYISVYTNIIDNITDQCITNECLVNNGGCAQLCIDTIDSYYCTCRGGYSIPRVNLVEACPGSCENFYADLVFVIDSSGSINDKGKGNWNLILKFMTDLIDNLDISHDKLVNYINIIIIYLFI